MRIIAGKLKGRAFNSPRLPQTHPMSDKIKGALFNMLGDLAGLTVLDAFAGSGAIGFEALSRGAISVVAIDVDRHAQQTIASNAQLLGVENLITVVRADADTWLSRTDSSFDVVVLDPPYDKPQLTLLVQIANCTKPGGIVVVSLPPKIEVPLGANFKLLRSAAYGGARLWLYRCLPVSLS
jgi:16S rRNA (guanine966-N2)-methyltransferase